MDDELIVTLTMDDGSEVECQIITIFEAGEHDYIALMPIDIDDGTYLYRYFEDEDGNPSIENIDDDDEYEIAADAYEEFLDDLEFEETFGEDDE